MATGIKFLDDIVTEMRGGDTSGAYKDAAKDVEAAQARLEAVKNQKGKSVEELAKEGSAAAGLTASAKAGEAKKQAKAAAVMNNASRLQAATAGAGAASKAASEGFAEAANQSTALAQRSDEQTRQQNFEAAKAQADADIAKANLKTQAAENEAQRKQSHFQSVLGALSGVMSSDKKVKTHRYISKEQRGR